MKKTINIFLLILFISCNSQKKELCLVKLEKNLSPKLNKNNLEREIINITDSINCLNWDSLLIESGYATNESIFKYYGLTIPYDFNNSNLDSEALIFFIKNNKIINHVKFNTTCRKSEKCKTYDFKTLIKYNKEAIISKKDAVFEVFTKETTNNRGEKWIQINAIRLKKS